MRSRSGRTWELSGSLVLWGICGCGAPAEKFVPVAGKVHLEGKPLTVGAVSLRPDASKGNSSMHIPTGGITAEGTYEVITIGKKGAPPGWYKVLVLANAPPGAEGAHPLRPKSLTNEKYRDEKSTDLFIEAVENPTPGAYDLDLRK